jgi:hypothetical protein
MIMSKKNDFPIAAEIESMTSVRKEGCPEFTGRDHPEKILPAHESKRACEEKLVLDSRGKDPDIAQE